MRKWVIVFLAAVLPVLGMISAADTGPLFVPKDGENLTYRVSCTLVIEINLGEEHLNAVKTTNEEGRSMLRTDQIVESTTSLVSYSEKRSVLWDPRDMIPVSEDSMVTQGGNTNQESIRFLLDQNLVMIDRNGAKNQVAYEPGLQTSTSLIHYLRTFPWERGITRIPLLVNNQVKWVSFEVKEEKEAKKVDFGQFDRVYHIYNEQLKYSIWFDRGPGHLPLEIRSKLSVGLAKAVLTKAVGYK